MKKSVILNLAACAALAWVAGCSSTKLDTVPVEDKTGTAVSNNAGVAKSDMSKSQVATVDVSKPSADQASPAGGQIVYFDFDSYIIKPEFQAVIENHARFIKGASGKKVAIEGHTDEAGGREYNLALGQRRSEAVRRALGLLGVADGQLEAVSFGKEKPAAQGNDEASMAKNRRAEIAYR